MSQVMTKSELRQIYLRKRRSLSDGELVLQSSQIAESFFESIDLITVKTVHTFIPIKKFNEIDTSFYLQENLGWLFSHSNGCPARWSRKRFNDTFCFYIQNGLVENRWGIREPADGKKVDPAAIDLVIVPLLCFDERGYRVGYGKGLYDKFLARCRPDCIKVGLGYFPPVAGITDVEDYDIKLDQCITPDKIFTFWQKRRGCLKSP